MSVLQGLWGGGKAKRNRDVAEGVVFAVAQAARAPALYGPGRAPDTFEVRLEMLMVFAAVAMLRLRRDQQDAAIAQEFADRLFKTIEYGLREAGVGDLTVPKKMKKLAGAFYGRLQAYDAGLAPEAAPEALAQALIRNVLPGGTGVYAQDLAASVRARHAALAALTVDAVATPEAWGQTA